MKMGVIVIVVIISCMNIFNLYVLIGVGFVVKKVVELGFKVFNYVKMLFVLGFKVVIGYFVNLGFFLYMKEFGFNFVGYGCIICIGNLGLFLLEIEEVVVKNDFLIIFVFFGNCNFEGCIYLFVKGNYFVFLLFVVVYVLVGMVNINLKIDLIGVGKDG